MDFDLEMLQLVVNSNKSDRIKIILRYQKINIAIAEPSWEPNSEKETLVRAQEGGLDIGVGVSPFVATHYLGPTNEADFNFRVCVLRGLPIVTEKWPDFILENMNDASVWSSTANPDPLFNNDLFLPNLKRPLILAGKSILLCYKGSLEFKIRQWLECLLPTKVHTLAIDSDTLKWNLSRSDKSTLLTFDLNNGILESRHAKLFDGISNSLDELWRCILKLDISTLVDTTADKLSFRYDLLIKESDTALNLKLASQGDLAGIDSIKPLAPVTSGDSQIAESKEKAGIVDSMDATPSMARSTQRKRRRKVERVSETDFFLFTLSNPPTQEIKEAEQSEQKKHKPNPTVEENPSSQPPPVSPVHPDLSAIDEVGNDKSESASIEPDAQAIEDSPGKVSDTFDFSKSFALSSADKDELDESEPTAKPSHATLKRKQIVNDNIQTSAHIPKKLKSMIENDKRMSFADAVISTKRKAEAGVKEELSEDLPIEEAVGNLVIVEEFELTRPPKATGVENQNQNYKGRKNFKTFRKASAPQKSITRTFLQLYDQSSGLIGKPVVEISASIQVANDFAGEMASVTGYQPESQQLFVSEDQESDLEEAGFSFLNGQTLNREMEESDDESDDAGVRFRFST